MKTLRILFLAILLVCSPMAHICLAQTFPSEELARSIHLPSSQGSIYQLLQTITEKTGYHLIYDSDLINDEKEVHLNEGLRTIAEAIYEITGNKHLQLSVQQNYILITPPKPITFKRIIGTLLDAESERPIPYGTIYLQGSSWGTVSNQDGQFYIHIPDTLQSSRLVCSHIGYQKQEINLTSLTTHEPVIRLSSNIVSLHEVIIRMRNPITLLSYMHKNREKNYPIHPAYLTTFYREGTHYKKKLMDLTEGIFKIYKPGVNPGYISDQVKQLKNNRISFRSEEDSLIAKISGGIGSSLTLDVMQHLPIFLYPESSRYECVYFFSDITWIEDRCTYVIHFRPTKHAKENFYRGEIYLDAETLALVQICFRIHPDHIKKATLVKEQGKYVKITPQSAEYTLSYRQWGDRYYVNHVRGDLHFKVKKKKSWFSRSPLLHTWFEMATCHIDTTNVEPFHRKERIRTHSIFMDTPVDYDPNFWQNFNIIPREKELKESIEQLKEQLRKATND